MPSRTKTSKRLTRTGVKGSGLAAGTARGGVVRHFIRGSAGKQTASHLSRSQIVEEIRRGLSVGELRTLQASLAVSVEKIASLLGISKATIHRRKSGQLLGMAESDRVVRFARLLGQATEVFGSGEAARKWLSAPQTGLGSEVPLEYARTEEGAREVEDLLGRIEHGVYS